MAEALLKRRRQLAAKVETTKGTAATLAFDASESKTLIWNSSFTTEFEVFEREVERATLDRLSHLIGKTQAKIAFDIEIRRTNATDVVDDWFMFLEGCGFKKTVNVGTSIVYKPSSVQADHKCMTQWLFIDGVRLGIAGAVGTVSFSGKTGQPWLAHFEFTGKYAGAADAALLAPTPETQVPAMFHNVGLSTNFGSALSPVMSMLELNVGNEIEPRESVNQSTGILHHIIKGRKPTGRFDPDLVTVATAGGNYYSYMEQATKGTIGFSIQSGKIAVALNNIQATAIEDSESGGQQKAGFPFAINGDTFAGDDSIVLTFT